MSITELRPLGVETVLAELYKSLIDFNDTKNAQLINSLRLKSMSQELTLAFCGYVSAGKSRLINVLLGEENLLPVSPLPTSKTIVQIKPGKPITVFEREKFHERCKDSTSESLELVWTTPEKICMIDTPGIDTFESGNLLENPALLQADLVIYVTDYNHVESQVNFNFLKTLETRRIPYLLIVNQIDKHVSLELSLADFRFKLAQSLQQWDLKPVGIFFTSLLEDRHSENQLVQLKQTLAELQSKRPELILSTLLRSVNQVLQLHSGFFYDQQDVLREPFVWVKEQPIEEQAAIRTLQQLEMMIQDLEALADTIELDTMKEIDKLLENAPLFSYETRELAKELLESRQPRFKAGFFAHSEKTKREQDRRLHKFYSELVVRSEANITWHLRKILADIPHQFNIVDEKFADEVSKLSVQLDPEMLLQTIHPGAMVSGEYVMNYTRDLAATIKSMYRKTSLVWIKRAQTAANHRMSQELPELYERLEHHQQILRAYSKLSELDNIHRVHMDRLMTTWKQVSSQYQELNLRLNQEIVTHLNAGSKEQTSVRNVFTGLKKKTLEPVLRTVHPKLWEVAQDLRRYADLAATLPRFQLMIDYLRQRASRLENNLFTVALFGAFSAGKSSLANALLGDNVLPVSPNPTTAVINKILPPTKEFPQGTIKVKLKNLSDLTTDVFASLSIFGLNPGDLSEALLRIPEIDHSDIPVEAKPHLSFLKAVYTGQSQFIEHLGEEMTVDYPDFRDFVIREEKACFVECIELCYACPLTESGIVLVDTPGSNSTNARHMNVAFDYIRNADAVLFVTYYNNPFCKSDAQFLSQLGKVKDAFEMDKMFFLVNASDLAKTPEELKEVLKHVEQNLRTFEIVRPRIFPVSSQLALLAKLSASGNLQPEAQQLYRQRLNLSAEASLPGHEEILLKSGLKQFENDFYSFVEKELINLAIESAQKEMNRVLNHVDGLLEVVKTNHTQRGEKLRDLNSLEQRILNGLVGFSLFTEENSVKQEIDELFYYVQQRVFHQFSDLFNQNFLVLTKPKEEQPIHAVEQCLRGLLQDIEVDLIQEIRATSLRVERFVQKTLNLVSDKYRDYVDKYDPACVLQRDLEFRFAKVPAIPSLSWDSNSSSRLSALYKNPKDWVEGHGRTKMRETALQSMQPQIVNWLTDCKNSFKEFWNQVFILESNTLEKELTAEIKDYYAGLAMALGEEYSLDGLEQVRRDMKVLAG